jgi:ABC-2 type transport system ATP-binding protein
MAPNIISIKKLYKEYFNPQTSSPLVALNHVNLEIPQGSFFGLLGPNGAGKSTIINILAGITNKTSGQCIVNGYDLDKDPIQAKLSLGVVPQEIVFDPFFTVRQAIDFYSGYFGIPKNQRRTEEIMAALSLTNKADVPSRSLSGGMKRRLLIAKALVHQPKILILDEPTAGVDIELREQLWNYIIKLNKAGTTIILTTHYIEEAEKLCSHIAIINHGTIVFNDVKNKILSLCSGTTLTVEFDQPIDALKSDKFLQKHGAEISSKKLTIKYSDSKNLDEFIRYILTKNIALTNVSTNKSHLEDILKSIIKNKKEEYNS